MVSVLLERATRRAIRLGSRRLVVRRFVRVAFSSSVGYEDWLDDLYEKMLAMKEGAFLDVGVNVGQALLKIIAIDPDRRYVGFEPQIAACLSVDHFILDNGLEHHCVLPVALSNRHGLARLQLRGRGEALGLSGFASLVEGFRPDDFYQRSTLVVTAPGDAVVSELDLDAISVIKIDVEGAELEVIEGLADTMERHRPFVVFEVLHHYLVATDDDLDDETVAFRQRRTSQLVTLLRSHGYRIYQIRGRDEIREVESIERERISDLTSTDYVAVHDTAEEAFVTAVGVGRRVVRL